jgi:chromosome partitioning protein
MIIISVASCKGGIAKTTTVCNLGASLALMNKKVLIVDIDKQSHSSIQFNMFNPQKPTINDIINGANPADVIQKTGVDGIYIIPSTKRIQSVKDRKDCLESLKTLDFDYVIIDCPPDLGKLTANALIISDYVLSPMTADRWGSEGLADVIRKIDIIRDKYNPRLSLLGVFLVKDEKSSLGNRIKKTCKETFQELFFDTTIRASKLVNRSSFSLPVVLKYPKAKVSNDYIELTNEVLKKCS